MQGKSNRWGCNTLIPHRFESGVEEKLCIACQTWKQLSEFHTHKKTSDRLYTYCKECSRAADRRRYRERNAKYGPEWKRRQEYFKQYQESGRRSKNVNARYRVLRDEVFAGYGGKCAKCGFADKRALHIDHVEGDGAEERKNGPQRATFLRHLIREGFPKKYQLLCANCNTIKMYENKEFPGWASHGEGEQCPRSS